MTKTGDGRLDEDPYEDLNGDGEIGLMYAPDPEGPFILKEGRLVRGKGQQQYRLVGREGIDNDKDGRYSEDRPGGVDLNRNFSVGHQQRKSFGGTSGATAQSEPETKAIVSFVSARPNINLFFDYHNAAKCLFYWRSDRKLEADHAFLKATAQHAESQLGYPPRPLTHKGAGLAIAWSYGERGIPSFLVELAAGRGDSDSYLTEVWKEKARIPVREFDHPQLGKVLIGNDVTKIAKRNPHPQDIGWQADRNWQWVKQLLGKLPQLELRQPVIQKTDSGFSVSGEVANVGEMPTDSEMARLRKRAFEISLRVEGGQLSGDDKLPSLDSGQTSSFRIQITDPAPSVTLLIEHPRAGTIRLPISRQRNVSRPIRKRYAVEDGYATPDRARLCDNQFYQKGVSKEERGPAFELKHNKRELRIAVLLGQWRDKRHTIPARAFEEAFFARRSERTLSPTGQQVYGSLRDFYEEMSYGKTEDQRQSF